MSLAQIYRDQTAQRQARRLLLYVLVAAALHAAGAAILWQRYLRQPAVQLTPIDFVYIEPQAQPVKPPANPSRQSQTNAVAGAKLSSRPPQSASQSAAQPAARSAAPPASRSAAPSRIQSAPHSEPAVPSPLAPSRPAPAPRVEAAPAQPADRTADLPPPRRSTPPASPPTAAGTSGAAALSPSDFYSLSVESGNSREFSQGLEPRGLAGQSSANRSGPGSSVDAAQSPWGGYLASLRQVIDQSWQSVPISTTSRTRVQFRVNRAGELSELRLLESSGNRQADEAALAAVQAAAPFAPLPPNATENVLVVNFTFTQWLKTDAP